MKHIVCQVWDEMTELWSPPYINRNKKVAIQGFMGLMNSIENEPNGVKNPLDYKLFATGEMDDENFETPLVVTKPLLIYTGAQWIEEANNAEKR